MSGGFNVDCFERLSSREEKSFWFIKRNELILWALEKYRGNIDSFLEIGCGTGFVIAAISGRYPEARVVGTEYFDEGLIYARIRLPQADLRTMDARSLPFSEEFDVIGAFDVIEHIVEEEIVVEQIFKALKRNGLAVITVPQHQWLWSDVDVAACHVKRYAPGELENLLGRSGFEVIRSTSFVTALLPIMYLSRVLKRNKMHQEAELDMSPLLNGIFKIIMSIDLLLIRAGLSLPFGGSRLVIARKVIGDAL
jgi:SAM-dependent methyltransferase